MEVDHTYPDDRYWSEILYCITLTHISDFEVKVTELEKKYNKVFDKVFRSLYCIKFEPNLIDTLHDIRYYSQILCCSMLHL